MEYFRSSSGTLIPIPSRLKNKDVNLMNSANAQANQSSQIQLQKRLNGLTTASSRIVTRDRGGHFRRSFDVPIGLQGTADCKTR
ncbi:hypothetical protein L596_012791 [Steinernema carpocapsae]|uniref:Uncharacterized protein n=1 Tax=Steinernema carpocapsae TaxID=34508 RepID=A0A4U5NY55_STECR|nr:hypothetical protein L596_012791 [Steinernema carpocapsae]